ncbi:hypothetical protein [Gluconacetobacter tumulisoli]|uniref:Uncharacterized protein n=1 Tax=Gluconacetobacter tumulisoli TaxID=1286189 RepID=A0A7W4K527_9PROT|nr:hypothetical protein [Gluconacetobacter tumulisoli]MBB2200549.1 hypothetical protein [Gluconacetobacter tumulisoli]
MTRLFQYLSDDPATRVAERGHGTGKTQHHPRKFVQDRKKAAAGRNGGHH